MSNPNNPGYRIFKPPIRTDRDWRVAYGLECIAIWKEAMREKEATGIDPAPHFPTEEEFREARRQFGKSLTRKKELIR